MTYKNEKMKEELGSKLGRVQIYVWAKMEMEVGWVGVEIFCS